MTAGEEYAIRVVAALVRTLVVKGTLTLAEGQELLEISDADMLSHRPPGMGFEEAIAMLSDAHRISEERS